MSNAKKADRKAAREAASEEHRTERMWDRLFESSNAIRKSIGRKAITRKEK